MSDVSIWRDVLGADHEPLAGPSVVSIGNFDGVHRGHRALLDAARSEADRLGLPMTAVTFDPHPVAVFAADRIPDQLTTIVERVRLLREAGADHVFVLAFDRRMAAWSPEEFIDRVIVADLQARSVVVGENFRFGSKAAGDVALLAKTGTDRGFEAVGFQLAGDDAVWSSTAVREALGRGEVARAEAILGRPYAVNGVVVRGDQRGRVLGFPTANLRVEQGLAVPFDGVYAGRVGWEGQEPLPAAISVGTNPTFGGVDHRVESYVLDRDDLDLYGRMITVEFCAHIRHQAVFDDVDELVGQVWEDVAATRRLLDQVGP